MHLTVVCLCKNCITDIINILCLQHSEELGKLYVRLGAACPFVYRTSSTSPPPKNSVLRVIPVYVRPEHVRDVVRRCPNHVAGAVREAITDANDD